MFQVRNLMYKYPRNRDNTIKGLDFDVRQGEIFGLLGPSGVGKSTTQKIMVRLLAGYEGEIYYRNRDLQVYGKDYYQEVGVGFEMPVHFSKLTAEENIVFFKKRRFYRRCPDPGYAAALRGGNRLFNSR